MALNFSIRVMKLPIIKTAKKLPNKLSALIRVAVADLAKAEKSKRYVVDMGSWHDPGGTPSSKCEVCFGGAVIAFSLKVSSSVYTEPYRFPESTKCKLLALDALRSGNVVRAAGMSGVCSPAQRTRISNCFMDDVSVPEYGHDNRGFKTAMRKIATQLEAIRC